MSTTPSEHVYLSPPHVSPRERMLLLDAFDSNWIAPLGPHVDAFERELAEKIGVRCAVALSSGTAALHLALQLLGVGPGDEVLTSTFTFAATANAVMYVGATPVFIDSEPETWNMDPDLLEEELEQGRKTGQQAKAVLAVDLYGQCADYTRIAALCEAYDVPLVEDAAEALGASLRGVSAGRFGATAAFSFNGNKMITTSGGGMLVTDSEAWAEEARFLATQAKDPAIHYQHSRIGYNYRMSNLLAAVGRGQLESLDDKVTARRANFDFYRRRLARLPGIEFMPEPEGFFSTRWLTAVTIDPARFGASREDLRELLARNHIESRPLWKPMHLQPVHARARRRVRGVSDRLFEQGLCLPSGSSLLERQLERICDLIASAARPLHGTASAPVVRMARPGSATSP